MAMTFCNVMGKCCAGLLGRHNSLTSLEIIEGDVLSAMMRLITSTKHKNQLAGLQARLMFDSAAQGVSRVMSRLRCVVAALIFAVVGYALKKTTFSCYCWPPCTSFSIDVLLLLLRWSFAATGLPWILGLQDSTAL